MRARGLVALLATLVVVLFAGTAVQADEPGNGIPDQTATQGGDQLTPTGYDDTGFAPNAQVNHVGWTPIICTTVSGTTWGTEEVCAHAYVNSQSTMTWIYYCDYYLGGGAGFQPNDFHSVSVTAGGAAPGSMNLQRLWQAQMCLPQGSQYVGLQVTLRGQYELDGIVGIGGPPGDKALHLCGRFDAYLTGVGKVGC